MQKNKEFTDLQKSVLNLAQQLSTLNQTLASVKVSLNVLRASLAYVLSPGNPKEALDNLQAAEKMALDADPEVQASQEDLRMLDLIQKSMQGGNPPGDT
jgi:hypothetical protein